MTDPRRPSDELRQEIAKVDLEIFALLDRRARISRRLGDLHRGNPLQLPLADHASIRALASRASDMPEEALLRIYREIFGACLALELPVEIAYAGVEGGPCHHAAGGRFGRTSKLRGVASASAAFDEVSKRRAEFAVVPFETSGGVGRAAAEATDMPSEGPVQAALMALLASDLRIAEMLDSTFDLHLVRRSADAAGIERVYGAPSDLAACERHLKGRDRPPTVSDVRTTRIACELAAQEPDAAAVASETFAAEFGLLVAEKSISDRVGDRVRYAVVGSRPSRRTGQQDVTSLVFTTRDAAGSLLDVLRVLAERGINLTNIHSHPVRGEAWNYLFYAEVLGHATDRPLVTAFEEIKRLARSFRILGSYPAP